MHRAARSPACLLGARRSCPPAPSQHPKPARAHTQTHARATLRTLNKTQRYVGIDQRAPPPPPPRGPGFEYRYLTEFQSHEPEFDYLKSLEIEEKINKVRWVRSGGAGAKHLLSTNDKTVKLWKVYERRVQSVAGFNVDPAAAAAAARGGGRWVGGCAFVFCVVCVSPLSLCCGML